MYDYITDIEENTYSSRTEEELPPEWASPYFVDESAGHASKKKGGFKKVKLSV